MSESGTVFGEGAVAADEDGLSRLVIKLGTKTIRPSAESLSPDLSGRRL